MTKIEWSNSLSVGVNLIDEQHKMLIQKIADLAEAVNKTQGAEKILKTLGFMVEYTDFHFSAEEELMKEHDYPEKESHLKQHAQFIQMLKNLEDDFEEEGATSALSTSINTYLINWLINHIQKVDVEFGAFLKTK
ncbi:MAG: bacteriohemerythrin [Candidatus Thorarchaeota archaeon]